MRMNKNDIPVKIDIPGAKARQQVDFGDVTGYGKISGEYFSLGSGADIAPLLQGLDGDLCQCPHWGHILEGRITVTYADDSKEVVKTGDIFYWPPGHSVRADNDTEMVLFSPQHEHTKVMDHILEKLNA